MLCSVLTDQSKDWNFNKISHNLYLKQVKISKYIGTDKIGSNCFVVKNL